MLCTICRPFCSYPLQTHADPFMHTLLFLYIHLVLLCLHVMWNIYFCTQARTINHVIYSCMYGNAICFQTISLVAMFPKECIIINLNIVNNTHATNSIVLVPCFTRAGVHASKHTNNFNLLKSRLALKELQSLLIVWPKNVYHIFLCI